MTDPIIVKILDQKRRGINCSESESATIKQWLHELKLPGEQKIVAEIQSLFPQEYEEFLDQDELNTNQDEYNILNSVADKIAAHTGTYIVSEANKLRLKFPYRAQYVLEEVIKKLQAAV